jgi:hypothetical protein
MKMNRNLMEHHAENLSELLVRIQIILRAIPSETLIGGFVRMDETSATIYWHKWIVYEMN